MTKIVRTPAPDHAPHPVDCLRRFLDACQVLTVERERTGEPEKISAPGLVALCEIGVEAGHLGVMGQLGLLTPITDALAFARYSPEQLVVIDRARSRFAAVSLAAPPPEGAS